MSAIDKKHLKTAKNILNKAQNSVADNLVNRELTQLANIGAVKGKRITLSLNDRLNLEKYLNHQLGQPIRNLSIDEADRLLASKQSNDEKLATGNVFDSLINMARHEKPLPICDEFALYTSPGVVMSAPLAQIDASAINHIVVIENGQLLTHWHQLIPRLPSDYQQALIVYKGHGTNQNQVRELLKQTREDCQIALFFDFDPAGIKMAVELLAELPNHNTAMLLPANATSASTSNDPTFEAPLEQLKKLNKPNIYHNQHAQLQWLEQQSNLPNKLGLIVQLLKQYTLAVTQEHLVSHEVELAMLHTFN